MPVSYLCAVDPNTGKTFLVGSMQDPFWEHFRLNMDMASGKITGGEIMVTDTEVDQEQCWILGLRSGQLPRPDMYEMCCRIRRNRWEVSL